MKMNINLGKNSPIESIEIISMNKESIFDEPYVEVPATPEDGGVTLNKELWLKQQKEELSKIDMSMPPIGRMTDYATSSWFASKVEVAGYMLGPVAVVNHNGVPRTLTAKSMKVTDFSEFLEHIKDRTVYPYKILFQPNLPVTGSVNAETFEFKPLDCPVIDKTAGYWFVRFGELTEASL